MLQNEFFKAQIQRLEKRFGEKYFSDDVLILIRKALQGLDNHHLLKITDHYLSTFRQAPLPKDFFEAAKKERAIELDFATRGGFDINHVAQKIGMKNILAKYYPECSTLEDAFNLERKKLNELAETDKETAPILDAGPAGQKREGDAWLR